MLKHTEGVVMKNEKLRREKAEKSAASSLESEEAAALKELTAEEKKLKTEISEMTAKEKRERKTKVMLWKEIHD